MNTQVKEQSYDDKIIDALFLLDLNPYGLTVDSLRHAYRETSKRYHPDINDGDEASKLIQQEVNEANDLLSKALFYSSGESIFDNLSSKWDEIKEERNRHESNNRVSNRSNATQSRVNPDNLYAYNGLVPKTIPFDHQVVAFNRFHDKVFFALFADMGTGKSKIAIDIAAYKYNRGEIEAVMIIAPNNVHLQWEREQFPTHCPIPYDGFVWEQSKWGNTRYRRDYEQFMTNKIDLLKVLFVNVESFQGEVGQQMNNYFVRFNKTMAVLDESTRIKSPSAKRSRAIRALGEDCVVRCILTGTPTAKSPLDIWSPFEFLKKDYFNMSWIEFRAAYSVLIKDFASRKQKTVGDYEFNRVKQEIQRWQALNPNDDLFDCLGDVAAKLGMSFRDVRHIHNSEQTSRYKNENTLLKIIAPDTLSVKKEDCLDLPEKVYEIIHVDMANDQRKAYDQLANYMMSVHESGAELEVTGILALLKRFMQICGGFFPSKVGEETSTILFPFKKNPKLIALLDDIEENAYDKQCIIWACFTAEIELITKSLREAGYTTETYHGQDRKEKRERTIAKFVSGEIQFLVANATVAGYGFNFQNCHYQYFFSNNYRTEARLQAEDRSHRAGQPNTCIYKDILLKNSIDQHIFNIIKEGKELNDVFKTIDDVEDALSGTNNSFNHNKEKSIEHGKTGYIA